MGGGRGVARGVTCPPPYRSGTHDESDNSMLGSDQPYFRAWAIQLLCEDGAPAAEVLDWASGIEAPLGAAHPRLVSAIEKGGATITSLVR